MSDGKRTDELKSEGEADYARPDSNRWVDFIEGELDQNLIEDMELLLSHSEIDQSIVNGLKKTRAMVDSCDDYQTPSAEKQENLHARIMAHVAETQMEAAPSPLVRRAQQRARDWRRMSTFFMGTGLAALFIAVLSYIPLKNSNNVIKSSSPVATNSGENANDEWLLQASAANPQAYSETVIGIENEEDMLVDAAAGELKKMNDSEAKAFINKLFEE